MSDYDLLVNKYLNQWKIKDKYNYDDESLMIESKMEQMNELNRKNYIKDKWKQCIQFVIDQKYKKLKKERNQLILEKELKRQEDEKKLKFEQSNPPPYGVCDDQKQFFDKYPLFNGRVNFFIIDRLTCHDWRWCKHGEYIGNYNLEGMEYLYEANGKNGKEQIDIQYMFRISSNRPRGY